MPDLDHTAFVNSRRDERSLGHHMLCAYSQDLRTFARFTKAHQLTDPLSKDDILAYHRHLRDELGARPATIERRLVTLKSYYAWREDRNSALPSPFADVHISVRIPRRLPRPIDRDILRAVLQTGEHAIAAQSARGADNAAPTSQDAVTLFIIKLLIVTGLRISELTKVKVRDVSQDGGQVLVRGKGSKERIVFVPNRKLQEEFRRYCQKRSEDGSFAAPLFLNTVGRRLRAATFRKRLRALSKRLGIDPHLTPHRFRHSSGMRTSKPRKSMCGFQTMHSDEPWSESMC
ncbi:tyrosine-type recombinase/integrase [uncultured Tateyamaria sp.]|uniref:tyrosine-type recombinase/integrase n=1 Tax=uncultured Tateyamaria sp. TaxID=455651 RepID=UPI00262D6ECB|nr:tyrosine-type recombinase/integrase [uncultured Tateyamaria sp.]